MVKVLMIDDDHNVQVSVGEFLKHILKFDVHSAFNGKEGLDRLNGGEPFDCIILDSNMPVMDGEEFLEKYDGPIPIIFSTAYGTDPPRPVAGVLPKPYGCRELGALIHEVSKK